MGRGWIGAQKEAQQPGLDLQLQPMAIRRSQQVSLFDGEPEQQR